MNTPRFCSNCGKQLLEQGKFCPFCGAPTGWEEPYTAEATPASETNEDAAQSIWAPSQDEEATQSFWAPPQDEEATQSFWAPPQDEEATQSFWAPPQDEEATQSFWAPPQDEEATQSFWAPSKVEDTPQPVSEPSEDEGVTQALWAPPSAGNTAQAVSEPPCDEDVAQAFSEPPQDGEPAQPFPTSPYTAQADQAAVQRLPRAERKKVGALRVVGSSALCLFAVLFGLAACLIFTLRSSTSPGAIESVLENVRIADLTVPAENGDTQLLSEYITEKIPEDIRNKYHLNARSIERLMERAFARDFLESKLEQIAESLYSGDGDNLLSSSEVKRFLNANAMEIYRVTGYLLTEKNLDEIGSYLENNKVLDSVSLDGLSVSQLQDKVPFLSVLPILTSYVTAILLAVLAVGLLVLAAWISRFRRFSLVYVSVACLFIGCVQLTLIWLTNLLAGVLHDLLPLQESFYARLLSPLRRACLRLGLPLIGVGLICIIALFISRAVCKKRRKAVPADPAYTFM